LCYYYCAEAFFREAISGAFFRNFVPEKPSGKIPRGYRKGPDSPLARKAFREK
jgi:hypothetical protein